jgi:acetyl-CoA synthetase
MRATAAMDLTQDLLVSLGVPRETAPELAARARAALARPTPEARWRALVREVLRPEVPHEVHVELHRRAFVDWDPGRGPAPAWFPTADEVARCNAAALARELGLPGPHALHAWSAEHREEFWRRMIARLGIRFQEPPAAVVSLDSGAERPRWLPGAHLNIVESCLAGDPDRRAITWRAEDGAAGHLTVRELQRLTNRVAHGLRGAGLAPGDAIAIDMPMTAESVAIYLGVIASGGVAVSIADSFAPHEIATRLRIAGARAIFTQDVLWRGGRLLPLYARVCEAGAPRAVVLPAAEKLQVELRPGDLAWESFLGGDRPFVAVGCPPDAPTNILFSSGTTGAPKAIPWTQTTPIKAATDGHLHHDIRPGDVVAWPTNLGWMMGPWLIYASLCNRASLALYTGAPAAGAGFARFVQDAAVTMLGVVPSLVKTWRETGCLDGADWRGLRAFSSTGECSNPSDYFWLMGRAGYRPVIEYCGGTEIGGGYACGTVFQPAAPSTFTTPAFGLDFVILGEGSRPADIGELCLIPPSIGFSDRLLNASHHDVYFEGMPRGPRGQVLRRHGDEFERLPGGYYRGHGRVDDTMNLGGIKVSSAEIERACNTAPGVRETAAIAHDPPGGGPSLLVIYVVRATDADPPLAQVRAAMQRAIREQLNPLFKIHDVVVLDALPRTASNKVMRRLLRRQYPTA